MSIRINGDNTAANPGITGTDTDTGLQFGTDEVNVVTGGTTAITVDSSQRVGIGSTSPIAELEVQGATTPEVMVRNTTTSSFSSLHLAEVGDSSGTFVINRLGSTSTATGGARAGQVWNSANAPIVFGTNGTEEMRLLSGGGLTFNGDTAAANALDDYEEGSWTPAISGATLSGGNTGNYTRIGRFVHAFFYCPVSSHNNDSTDVEITGLPFTGIERSPGVSLIVRNGIDHTIQLLGTHGSGSFSSIKFAKTVNDGNSNPLKLNDCNTSWHLAGVMTYHAQ